MKKKEQKQKIHTLIQLYNICTGNIFEQSANNFFKLNILFTTHYFFLSPKKSDLSRLYQDS